MKKSFWQTRLTLIVAGVVLGLAARAILGDPPPEVQPGPAFEHPLPEEVPFSMPLIKPLQPTGRSAD